METGQVKKIGITFLCVIGLLIVILICVSVGNGIGGKGELSREDADKKTEKMIKHIGAKETSLIKGEVDLSESNLADELPELDPADFSVRGNGDIDIEIFASGEKAGAAGSTDGWMTDAANAFNNGNYKVDGQRVTVSIRSISSGLGSDYIISGKYLPDAYTPSNSLWGDLINAQGGNVTMAEESLAGNTAGILLSKKKKDQIVSDYGEVTLETVVQATSDGKLAMGYTNPLTSATGLNFLVSVLYQADEDNPLSDNAKKVFNDFQANVPYTAYTTQQMVSSAQGGSLDGMVMEYQAYYNDAVLSSGYEFIPFGIRHDNPLYAVGELSNERQQALNLFINYLKSDEQQKKAEKNGFNKDNAYEQKMQVEGKTVVAAQKLWKEEKDGGKPVIAVFVADVSGSMDGEPINSLKESLVNASKYIGENNYIGLVSYANDVAINLPVGKFDLTQHSYFNGAVQNLYASGSTATYDAVMVAVDMLLRAQEAVPDSKLEIFLLSDGEQNTGYSLSDIQGVLRAYKIPVYTIGYNANLDELSKISEINEAAGINAETDDVVYKLKSLFNAQM